MQKITVNIEGMMCGMCESHMDKGIQTAFPSVKKVTSSHINRNTVIISPDDIPDDKLEATVTECGYTFISAVREPYEKKIIFSIMK